MQDIAKSTPITLAPKAMILALLCCFVSLAEYSFVTKAARIPGILFAAIEIPIPVPQIKIPKSAFFI